jgi:hypothetical protein
MLCSRAMASSTPPVLVSISSGDRRDSRRRLAPRWLRSLLACAERLRTGAGAGAATRVRAGRMGARVWREAGQVGRRVRSSSAEPLGTRRARRRGASGRHGWVLAFLMVSCAHAVGVNGIELSPFFTRARGSNLK